MTTQRPSTPQQPKRKRPAPTSHHSFTSDRPQDDLGNNSPRTLVAAHLESLRLHTSNSEQTSPSRKPQHPVDAEDEAHDHRHEEDKEDNDYDDTPRKRLRFKETVEEIQPIAEPNSSDVDLDDHPKQDHSNPAPSEGQRDDNSSRSISPLGISSSAYTAHTTSQDNTANTDTANLTLPVATNLDAPSTTNPPPRSKRRKSPPPPPPSRTSPPPATSRSPPPPDPPPTSTTDPPAGDDSSDDGYGINGIGYRPTPAQASARAHKRRQQVAAWRAREAREAREKRSVERTRRRGGARAGLDAAGVEGPGLGHGHGLGLGLGLGIGVGIGVGGGGRRRVVRFA